jgi:hypothetical protein
MKQIAPFGQTGWHRAWPLPSDNRTNQNFSKEESLESHCATFEALKISGKNEAYSPFSI